MHEGYHHTLYTVQSYFFVIMEFDDVGVDSGGPPVRGSADDWHFILSSPAQPWAGVSDRSTTTSSFVVGAVAAATAAAAVVVAVVVVVVVVSG